MKVSTNLLLSIYKVKTMKKIISSILSILFIFQAIIPINAMDEKRQMIYENDYLSKYISTEESQEYV